MPAEPTGDAELVRLLNVYALALYQSGVSRVGDSTGSIPDARAALLAYIAATYVRRDRLVPDEWDDLDATVPPLTPTPADVDAGKARWTEHGWQWTDYRAARGVLPHRPGDALPEVRIRRLRDDADHP
jgi:hypothetical protein